MRMYEVIDREKVLLETPEVLIERVGKTVPRQGISVFANDLADKLRAQKKEDREEDDLVLLWKTSCIILHSSLSPVKRDKEYMDYEDRQQDVYFLMDKLLDDELMYGTDAYTRALKYRWDDKIYKQLLLPKNKYSVVNIDTAEEDNEPAMSIWMEDASNMREYLLDNYGDFAAEWFYLKFVCGYKDLEIYTKNKMSHATHERKIARLKKEMKNDTTLLEMWESM